MPKKELFDATLQYHGEAEKAIKCSEGKDIFWLPKSQLEYEKDADDSVKVDRNGCFEVTMPLWLAQEKKLAGA